MTNLRTPRTRWALRLRSAVALVTSTSLLVTLSSPSVFAKPPVSKSKTRAARKAPPSSKPSAKPAHIRVETARLRSGPGQDNRPMGLLDEGRTAKVIGRRDGWAKVRLGTGTEGWVRSDLLKVSNTADKAWKVAYTEAQRKEAQRKAVAAQRAAEAAATKKKQEIARAAKAKQLAAAKAAKAAQAKQWAQAKAAKAQQLAQAHAAKAQKQHLAALQQKQATEQATKQKRLAAQAAWAKKVAAAEAAKARAPAVAQAKSAPWVKPAVPAKPALQAKATSPAPAKTAEERGTVPNPVSAFPAPETVAVWPAEAAVSPEEEPDRADRSDRTEEAAASPNASENPASRPMPAAPMTPLPTSVPSRGDRLVRTALTYRGTPYRFGARGQGAFDCSGFTWYLWKKAGSPLPRTAAQQYKKGVRIPKDQMQPGDLVFFKNTYKRGISHVGVYIGDGQFVHASSGGHSVRVDSLSKPYYVNHWAGARRHK